MGNKIRLASQSWSNMFKNTKQQIDRHLKTHTVRSQEDNAAVATIKSFFKNSGKIKDTFTCDDKWPNHDGTIEIVPNPSISRQPFQSFYVQIKGTSIMESSSNGRLRYRLQNLAFPAYSYSVTLDPCVLFVVINPNKRGKERILWKYMSAAFLKSIDFSKQSYLIDFEEEEEIFDNDYSIDNFVDALVKVSENHSFASRLENIEYNKSEVLSIIADCDEAIVSSIAKLDFYNVTRDNISQKMLNRLEGFCSAVLLLNAFWGGYEKPSIKVAWEYALLNIKTKYLATFLQRLRYLARRIPLEGQSERLMVQYYDFLWQIRKTVSELEGVTLLRNLERFPLQQDKEDEDYYELIAKAVDAVSTTTNPLRFSRYYIQKKTPFFIGGERYYEITLQLSDIYATKYNRLTVYTKLNISTDYSVQIGYEESKVELWGKNSYIKVVTNWKVAIDPTVLNKFASIFGQEIRISSKYGEYAALMEFLTCSGINLLDLIDFSSVRFNNLIEDIYFKAKTGYFKNIIKLLHRQFSASSGIRGRNTIRYILLGLREDVIDDVKLGKYDKAFPNKELFLNSLCCPFESNPILYNLPKHKTNSKMVPNDIVRTIGLKGVAEKSLYLTIKYLSETTGEIYINKNSLNIENVVGQANKFNNKLSDFDRDSGCMIREEDEFVYIEGYERTTLAILQKLLQYAEDGNQGQQQLNNAYLKAMFFEDDLKRAAIEKAFIESKVMMIYGAAGTGKTQLIDYLSNLMAGRSKLFLAKTHTAEENLKRRITAPGQTSAFLSIDQYIHSTSHESYDVVFIDECSIIDNRTMLRILNSVDSNSLLVLVGDIYQIESIEFGNWFLYAKDILKRSALIELTGNWRTQDETIKSLWDAVRNREEIISEKLVIDGPFSENIGENLFVGGDEDGIVLCLNYDGRYGLNNLNRYFQDANTEKYFSWHEWKYKVGDPILFNDSRRFTKLYNNLKGHIVAIEKTDYNIAFTVEVYTLLTGIDAVESDFEFIEAKNDRTRIKFVIYENQGGATEEEREEARKRSIVPFQIAYAVSIHKAQGLEFGSVKIVVPNSNAEQIRHGIFYTAITRTTEKLKIFWSAETMKKVISGFQNIENKKTSLEIVKRKLVR